MAQKIVFLVYDSRSGSTFLSSRLAAFPDIDVSVESRFMLALLAHEPRLLSAKNAEEVHDILSTEPQFANIGLSREDISRHLPQHPPYTIANVTNGLLNTCFPNSAEGGARIVKDGANGFFIRKIAASIPDALFLHIIRDGRAVLNSKSRTERPYGKGETMARDPITAARFWTGLADHVDTFAAQHPERVLVVRYEDLLTDEGRTLKGIRGFLGLPTDAEAGESSYHKDIPAKEAGIHKLVGGPAVNARINGWKEELDHGQCLLFDALAHETLLRHGYQPLTRGRRELFLNPGLWPLVLSAFARRIKDWTRLLANPGMIRRHLLNRILIRKG